MRGKSAFEPARLIEALGPYNPASSCEAAAIRAYYDFYELDFRAQFPGLRHSLGWVTSGSHRLAVQSFIAPGARGTAVVCHGYYDHVGLYGHLLRFLLAEDLAVLTFDQPGHGLSSGARASIDSFAEYVNALDDVLTAAAALPRPWHLIGQSMGAAVVMEYLVQHTADDFAKVVLLAPLIRPAAWVVNRIVHKLARRFVTERPRTLTRNAENPEFLDLMAQDPLAPQTLPMRWIDAMAAWLAQFEAYPVLPFEPLVVQGHADRTVGWRYNLKLLASKCSLDLLEMPAARHHLVNESPQIRREMFAWLAPRLRN